MLIMVNVHNYGMVLFSLDALVRELRSVVFHFPLDLLHQDDMIMFNLQKLLITIRQFSHVSGVSNKESVYSEIPHWILVVCYIQ